jgi:hypothetical protein
MSKRAKGKKLRGILIVELISRAEEWEEGLILRHYFRMLERCVKVYYFRCTYPCELLRFLNETVVLDKIDVIHVSSHGDVDREKRAYIKFAHQLHRLYPEQMPGGIFKGRICVFSSCNLGRKSFTEPFLRVTGARAVIAPKHTISPYEAVGLWLWFYKKIVNDGYGVAGALKNAKSRTGSHGGMCVTFASSPGR